MLRLDALHYYQSKLDIQKECKLNAHITQLIKIMEEGLGLYVKEKSRVNSKSAVSKAESYEVLDLSFFLLLEAIEKNPVKQKDLRKELYMWRHQVLRGNEFVPNPNIINEKAKIKFEHLIKELECVKKNHNKWGCALIEMMCSLESEKLAEFVGGLDDPSVNNEIKDKIWAMIRKNLASTKDENLLARLYEAYFSINSENKVDLKNKVSLKNVIRYLKMDVDKGFINMDKGFAASVEHKNNEINNLKAFEVRVGQPKEEIDFLIQALDQVMNTQNKERLGNSIVSMLNSLEDIEFIKFIDEFVSGRYVSQDKKEEFWVRVKESIGEKVGNNNDFLVKLYFACGNDKSGREKRATLSDHAFKIEIFTIDNLKQLEDRKLDWLVLSINSLKNGEADEKGTISAIDTILEHPFISSRTKLGLWQTLANVVLREEPKFKDLQNQLSEKFKMEPIVWAYLLQVFSPDRSKIMERNVNIMCKDGFDKTEETLLNIICKDKNMRGEVRQFLNKIYEGKPYEDESYGKKLFNIVPELKAMIQLGDCLEALACDKEIDKNIGVLTHIILKLQGHDSQAVCSQACNVRAGKMLLDFVEKMQKEINSSWGLCTSKKEILNTINTLFSKDDTTLPNFYIRSFFGDEFEKLDFAFDLNDEVMAKHLIFVAELLVKRASFAYCGENGEQEINASNILKEGTGKKQLKNDFKEGTLGHELLKYISNMLAEIQTKENKMAEGMGFSLH